MIPLPAKKNDFLQVRKKSFFLAVSEAPPGPRIVSRLELLSYRIVAILTRDAEYVANAADA